MLSGVAIDTIAKSGTNSKYYLCNLGGNTVKNRPYV